MAAATSRWDMILSCAIAQGRATALQSTSVKTECAQGPKGTARRTILRRWTGPKTGAFCGGASSLWGLWDTQIGKIVGSGGPECQALRMTGGRGGRGAQRLGCFHSHRASTAPRRRVTAPSVAGAFYLFDGASDGPRFLDQRMLLSWSPTSLSTTAAGGMALQPCPPLKCRGRACALPPPPPPPAHPDLPLASAKPATTEQVSALLSHAPDATSSY